MHRFARMWLLPVLMLALLALPVGCTGSAGDADAEASADIVRLSGSGTCMPLLHLLTENYVDSGIEWRFLPGLHTGGGVQGVANGDLEIGATSRELTAEEAALGLEYTHLSDDGIVIAVHPSVAIDSLTTQQVCAIYSGAYSNWSELGGPDLPITILDRNEDESAKIIMRKYVFGPDLVIAPAAAPLYYEPDMIQGVQSTAGAIGYFSLGYSISRDIPVIHVMLDGVEPTVANVKNGSYPVVRPLGVVTSANPGERIAGFLEWATSDEGQVLIEANGFAAPR